MCIHARVIASAVGNTYLNMARVIIVKMRQTIEIEIPI